ncbi:hypothetical protein SAMN05216197_12622 [Pseudomonas graminis]|uniref:Uncharacterized protein n=2 Tax=Pseudomonas graminis TaxID=158627 RepID=A0A1I0H9R6_9PSED|nr:hypothetical protein SAMN05216197_12622 [Pseudomonas graminis]
MGWLDGKLSAVKKSVSHTISSASEAVAGIDIKEAASGLADAAATAATAAATKTKEASVEAYVSAKEKLGVIHNTASEAIYSFDYSELAKTEFYSRNFTNYRDLSTAKVTELYRSTFEVDKTTMEMVDDIRRRLPVPAQTVDDIFEQCKHEAMRRAIAAFALGGVLNDIDNHSASKYENLTDRYSTFVAENSYQIKASKPFADLVNERNDASITAAFLDNGYNSSRPLDPAGADIEHVISKKDLYVDPIIRVGTTNDQYFDLINARENLVFADHSLNRSMGSRDVLKYIEDRGRPVEGKPGVLEIDIKQRDGTLKVVQVSEAEVAEAYSRAADKRSEHRLAALQEVGQTIALTGAAMAAQQIVGLIVLETIDIFVDELKSLATKGNVINEDGWLQNSTDAVDRIRARLTERFEERQIWVRAKKTGLEAGVAGSLSVIPQILISLIIKIPAFVLGLIRECTLSVVRCVRVMLSNDLNKLDSMKILLAGAASAIVGVYVGRAVSTAISGIPLLNQFNSAITGVLTGVVVTAVPLAAVYAFEQNKNKLAFMATSLRSQKPVMDEDDGITA